jgi:hypothetical protein
VKLTDTSRIKMEYVKNKINKQGTNGKNKNIWVLSGVDKFKVYQARTIFIKDDMGDMLAASHSILSRWKN